MGEEAVCEFPLRSSFLRLQRLQNSLTCLNDKQNSLTASGAEVTASPRTPALTPAQPQPQAQIQTPALPQPQPGAQPQTPETPALQCKPSKRRRHIQFVFEMMGCPPEYFPDGSTCWEGDNGVINKIRDVLGLKKSPGGSRKSRARQQIRTVLSYIQDCMDQGMSDFDAGSHMFACIEQNSLMT